MQMAYSNEMASMIELSIDEIDFVSGAYTLREHAEAFLVGAGAGAIVSGGNPLGTLAGGVIAVGVLYL